jgi:hypothetical protein
MKKTKQTIKNSMPNTNNLVAKHAHHFNKALIFKDKSKYHRKSKHKNFDPFLMICVHIIKKGSKFSQAFPHTTMQKNTVLPGKSPT